MKNGKYYLPWCQISHRIVEQFGVEETLETI